MSAVPTSFKILIFIAAAQTLYIFYYGISLTPYLPTVKHDRLDDQATRNIAQTDRNTANKSLHDRLSFYQSRYDYHPAAPRNLPSSSSIRSDKVISGKNITLVCGSAPSFDTWYQRGGLKQGRSVNNEDKRMYNIFYKQLGPAFRGTFVEMGAFDGVRESNSLFFETCLGWEGLLIEANPKMWPHLVENRPYAHLLHYAPSCNATSEANNATIPFYSTIFTNAGQATSDVKSEYNPWSSKPVQVPCGTLTNVLRDILPDGRVMFFSLDVEGAEPLVIGNAIDFDAVFIEVLMVEQFNNLCPKPPEPCESREKVRAIMKDRGYTLYDGLVEKSDVYVHPMSKFLSAINNLKKGEEKRRTLSKRTDIKKLNS